MTSMKSLTAAFIAALTLGTALSAHAAADGNDAIYAPFKVMVPATACTKDNHRVNVVLGVHPSLTDLARNDPGLSGRINLAVEGALAARQAARQKDPATPALTPDERHEIQSRVIGAEFLRQAGVAQMQNPAVDAKLTEMANANAPQEKIDEYLMSVGEESLKNDAGELWKTIVSQLKAEDFVPPSSEIKSGGADGLTIVDESAIAQEMGLYYSKPMIAAASVAAPVYEQKIEDSTGGISVQVMETFYQPPQPGCAGPQ